jgi:PAS domain S-box-containing protein
VIDAAPRTARRRAAMLPELLLTFGGALVVVAISAGFAYVASQRTLLAADMLHHTEEVLGELRAFQVNLGELVAAVRAFLLTGDAEQLAQRDLNFVRMNASLDTLQQLTRDNPAQQALLAELRPQLVAREAVLQTAVAAYRRGGTPAVQELAKQNAVLSRPAREVSFITRRFEDNENALLQQRQRQNIDGTRQLRVSMVIFLACTIALLALLFLRARRNNMARDRAEAAVELQSRFLESVIENIPNMLFIKEADKLAFTRMNRSGEELLGVPREALLGKNDYDLFPPEMADQFTSNDREVLASGRMLDIESEPLQTPRGIRYMHTKKVPIFDALGAPAFLLGISEDVTERRAFEDRLVDLNHRLERNSLQLEAANRELESFSYSVSHDLRAPLRAIDGYAGLIEEECIQSLNDDGRRYLAAVREGARKMGVLIDDLLAFSRLSRQPMLPGRVNTGRVVDNALADMRAGGTPLRAQFRIGELPDCTGDEHLLVRVWVNLLENAVKYSSKSPHPIIDVRGERRADQLVYSVRDNGVGFDMRYYDKLFNVFQRLHSEAEFPGTGVGLATVHRIVSRHGGRVWAEALPGEGASFFFSLPITPVAVEPTEDATK